MDITSLCQKECYLNRLVSSKKEVIHLFITCEICDVNLKNENKLILINAALSQKRHK